MKRLFGEILGVKLTLPLPRIKFNDAMEQYGSDKPDIRFDMKLIDLSSVVKLNSGQGKGEFNT